VIARIMLAIALVLLVAAPAQALAGSVHFELVEEPAPAADDETAAPFVSAHAAPCASAIRPPASEDIVTTAPVLAGIFRPPRPSRG
jgi:hypothetical protein